VCLFNVSAPTNHKTVKGGVMQFTKEEIVFLVQTLTQVSFKPGQSNALILAETIINKCTEKLQSEAQQTPKPQ
jgi:hypothetical protein